MFGQDWLQAVTRQQTHLKMTMMHGPFLHGSPIPFLLERWRWPLPSNPADWPQFDPFALASIQQAGNPQSRNVQGVRAFPGAFWQYLYPYQNPIW